MPLSDHEQRLLEQMERVLAAEDPKLASTLRGADRRTRQRRRTVVGSLGFVVGIGVLFASVVVPQISGNLVAQVLVGGLGFLLMLFSAYAVATGLRGAPSSNASSTSTSTSTSASAPGDLPPGVTSIESGGRRGRRSRGRGSGGKASFMARMEERWRRRREGY